MKNLLNSSKFKRLKQYLWDIVVNELSASYISPLFMRRLILSLSGLKISNASIHAHCYFGSKNVEIRGRGTYINRGCFFDNENGALIEIGENCAIGYNVTFLTTNHDMSNPEKRGGEVVSAGIKVGNGCWIGANSLILPGITISNGCVVAAGAIVTKDCDPNCIYAGVPAKKIKELGS